MDRAERAGLGVAAAGHVVLFAALSASFLATPRPVPPPSMDVSLIDEVALDAAAPPAVEPPAASVAPENGLPEDAAPPPAPTPPTPDPAPPAKQPEAARPTPAPAAKPQPKQAAAPAAPSKPPTPAKPAPALKSTPKQVVAKGNGAQVTSPAPRPRGAILGSDFLKGVVAERSQPQAKGEIPRAAVMSAQAAADIGSAIQRQIQPCANRQIVPGPGAEKIRVAVRLSINRDGSLAGRPQVVGHDGVDDGNARYVDRVDDLAIATFIGCAPLRGLPADLYDVPRGWKLFTLRYKLPG